MSGVKTNSKKFTTPTVAHANFSGACLAKDFGAISPNSSVMTVITIVETVGPLPPFRINENNSVLIVAEAILTMLLPINTEVKNLSKIYGKGDTIIKAVDDVSFTVEQGEFVAIIGPSGSGKSTLLHIIGGVDTPTEGNVIIDGTDITKLKESPLSIFRRRQIGLVYQFYNLIPILTVEENLTLPLLLDGRKPNKEQIDYLVSNLGLSDRLKHLPNQLSGGQQQRVSIGRALANNPALLLADEPTGNLDSENSKEIVALLRKFNREHNQTVIMITHDERIAQSADRIIAIEDGKIVKDEVSKG